MATLSDSTGVNARKLTRVHAMSRSVLDELHRGSLDQPARDRLQHLTYDALVEMGSAMPSAMLEEFSHFVPRSGRATATEGELRVVWAQMLGWLNGVALGEEVEALRRMAEAEHRGAEARTRAPGQERNLTPYL